MTWSTYVNSYWDFWLIWVLAPCFLIIYGIKLINFNSISNQLYPSSSPIKLDQNKGNLNNKNLIIFQIIFLLLLIFSYSLLILYKEDFVGNDYSQITLFSLRGRLFGLPIWSHEGRFFPLGHQEFNLISLFTKTSFGYHLFPIFQIIVVVFSVFYIFTKEKINNKVLVIILILMTPSFVQSYFSLIIPERNLIFWLTLFILFIQRFDSKKSLYNFIFIVTISQFIIYYKEPSFLFISGFALSRLLIKFIERQQTVKSIKNIINFIHQNWLEISLLLLSALFVLLYIITILPNITSSYVEQRNELTRLMVLTKYLSFSPLLSIFLLTISSRIILVSQSKIKFDLLWDSLAIGALFYFLAYIVLNLYATYYLAPVDFIAILYCSIIADKFLNINKYNSLILLFLITLLSSYQIYNSSYIIVTKKLFADGRIKAVEFIQKELKAEKYLDYTNLVFPGNRNYDVMEFSAFMNYKNIPLFPHKKYPSQSSMSSSIAMIKIQQKNPKDNCVPYISYLKCYYSPSLQINDRIVILPQLPNGLLSEDIQQFKDNYQLIYHYDPYSSDLQWMIKILEYLHPLPDKWFELYIFKVAEKKAN
ncbi:hypothetical protein [Crocosphaera sp.]|uniref:hypothetical protein n=1 Tax=Crocosphaera sp. TaxID=2729996 RepID=UPI00260AFF0E|nr:hypothetical protein [Crocosphaera sp.]MDJ0580272.1 hypothetical protein [Crocosphaera sp.]